MHDLDDRARDEHTVGEHHGPGSGWGEPLGEEDVSRKQVQQIHKKSWVALTLALIGGFVDAVGYLVLLHMFTAHMSGNSISMGIHLGKQEWESAFHRAFPIPIFVGGVILGGLITEVLARQNVRSTYAVALTLEVGLLVVFMVYGPRDPSERTLSFYLLATLPALAMGLQNATLRRIGGKHVRTTYISGMLTNLGEEIVIYLFWLWDRRRWNVQRIGQLLRVTLRQEAFNRMGLHLAIWVAYAAGAILGTIGPALAVVVSGGSDWAANGRHCPRPGAATCTAREARRGAVTGVCRYGMAR